MKRRLKGLMSLWLAVILMATQAMPAAAVWDTAHDHSTGSPAIACISADGNYYLDDSSPADLITVEEGVQAALCLNGKTIDKIEVEANAKLSLCNCQSGGGVTTEIETETAIDLAGYQGSGVTINWRQYGYCGREIIAANVPAGVTVTVTGATDLLGRGPSDEYGRANIYAIDSGMHAGLSEPEKHNINYSGLIADAQDYEHGLCDFLEELPLPNYMSDVVLPSVTTTLTGVTPEQVLYGWKASGSASVITDDATTVYELFNEWGAYCSSGAVTLEAQWADKVMVSYLDRDGIIPDADVPAAKDQPHTLKNGADRVGYTFDGWQMEGTGAVYQAGSIYTVTQDTVFYALWDRDPDPVYTVAFDANGGTGTIPSEEVTAGDYTLPESGVTRTGYALGGWQVDGAGTVYPGGGIYNITADTTFYAVWDPVSAPVYTVSFDANGGTGTMSPVNLPAGDYTLPANGFTAPADHRFKTWALNRADSGDCYNVGAVYTVNADTVFYAVWEADFIGPSGGEEGEPIHGDTNGGKTDGGWDLSCLDCPRDSTCPYWPYTDTDTNAWYHDGVHFCVKNELMVGYGNNIFKPNADTTRAMLAVMLWRLNGAPVVNYLMDFEDVESEAWYTEAVRWARAEGVAMGYGNGFFGPDDVVTREQMVTILWQYAKYKGYDVSVGENTNILSYDDAFDVAGFAIPAMQWACGAGMLVGRNDPNGSGMILDPQGATTRAQMATVMMRFCSEVVK